MDFVESILSKNKTQKKSPFSILDQKMIGKKFLIIIIKKN